MAVTPYLNRDNCGFTLIELVVVMVLLSIVTAFAVPVLRTSLFSDQLKATARRLIGLVNEVGQAAGNEQQELFLVFAPQKREFQVRGVTGDAVRMNLRPVSVPEDVQVVDFTTVHGGINSAGELRLRFTKNGYVDKTLIHLRDTEGRELTLALSPFLGVSRLYDSYRTLEDDDLQW